MTKLERDVLARAVAEMSDGWLKQVKADPELGGRRLKRTLENAQYAMRYGTAKFRKLLDETGYGNHPEVVRFCARIGAAIRTDLANVLYPPMVLTRKRTTKTK